MHDMPPYAQPQLAALSAHGVTVVLAHPERNLRVVRDPAVLQPFARAGVLFQVNSGSLLGDFGREVRKTANSLVSSGLCHFVASDAHNSGSRGFSNANARDAVEKIVGEAQTVTIFEDNPARLLGRTHRG
jgi:protein-tyrosine phosphatase